MLQIYSLGLNWIQTVWDSGPVTDQPHSPIHKFCNLTRMTWQFDRVTVNINLNCILKPNGFEENPI